MKRIVSILILACFSITGQMGSSPLVYPSAYAVEGIGNIAQEFRLPTPGVRVSLSPEFNPPILKGIKVHPDNPFRFDFILDKGDSQLGSDQLKNESARLIKYFLASLTIPEKDLWVNLSPYEKDRIIPNNFGLTEMGRDLLAEDYMLKQITASLIYPEDQIGKEFWKRIYEEAQKKYGTTNIPVNTFNKVWIIPEKAVIYENTKAGTAYVVESKLKVMLEEDYLSLSKHECRGRPCVGPQDGRTQGPPLRSTNSLGSQIVREIVIPELTKEVNKGKNFAYLKQVYSSLILAAWYKKKIKDSILSQLYADKSKVRGINYHSGYEAEAIYQRYLQAFKKGVFNYIKEDAIPIPEVPSKEQEILSRKYFSGGITDLAMNINIVTVSDAAIFAALDKVRKRLITIWVKISPFTETKLPVEESPQVLQKLNRVPVKEAEVIYRFLLNQTRIFQGEYVKRFVKGVNDSSPRENLDFSGRWAEKQEGYLEEDMRNVVAHRMVRSRVAGAERSTYWVLKNFKRNKTKKLKRSSKDSSKYEMLTYLLAKEAGENIPEVRALAELEAQQLGINKRVGNYYLEKLVSDRNWQGTELAQRDWRRAFCGLETLALFLEKIDPSIWNTGSVDGIPVSLDNDMILFDQSEDAYFVDLLSNHVLSLAVSLDATNREVIDHLYEHEADLEQLEKGIQNHGLGAGLIAAEGLNPADIAKAVLRIKQIQNIGHLVEKAGFTGEETRNITFRLRENQRILGRRMGKYWQILSGVSNNDFLQLDKVQRGRAYKKRTDDAAMVIRNGGIDLTQDNLNLQTQNAGEEIKFHLDPTMLAQLQNAPGFVPVIINIQPMTDLRLFLGL